MENASVRSPTLFFRIPGLRPKAYNYANQYKVNSASQSFAVLSIQRTSLKPLPYCSWARLGQCTDRQTACSVENIRVPAESGFCIGQPYKCRSAPIRGSATSDFKTGEYGADRHQTTFYATNGSGLLMKHTRCG